jgi:hypothetical protein
MVDKPVAKISSKGKSQDDVAKLVAWAKENAEKLSSCMRHDFARVDPDAGISQWRCGRCGGVVSGEYAVAYRLGLKHAGASNA